MKTRRLGCGRPPPRLRRACSCNVGLRRGRLICAAGRAGVTFDASRAAVTIGSIVLFKDGQPHDDLAPKAAEYLKGTDLTVGVDLGSGSASSTVWTCDLSAEYVRINADYRT